MAIIAGDPDDATISIFSIFSKCFLAFFTLISVTAEAAVGNKSYRNVEQPVYKHYIQYALSKIFN